MEETQKTTKPQKPQMRTIASVFRVLGAKGAKDRLDLTKKILANMNEAGQTLNIKGRPLTVEAILRHVNTMCREIGKQQQSWWVGYKVEEDKNSFKLKLPTNK